MFQITEFSLTVRRCKVYAIKAHPPPPPPHLQTSCVHGFRRARAVREVAAQPPPELQHDARIMGLERIRMVFRESLSVLYFCHFFLPFIRASLSVIMFTLSFFPFLCLSLFVVLSCMFFVVLGLFWSLFSLSLTVSHSPSVLISLLLSVSLSFLSSIPGPAYPPVPSCSARGTMFANLFQVGA